MKPLNQWDVMAILYSLVGSAILAAIVKWFGLFRWARRKYRNFRGIRTYKKELTDECQALIVVGRRIGFTIKDVYIDLDLAPSDLMPAKEREARAPQGSFVLVGGPGAGKSTIGKKCTLDALGSSSGYPFFARLRDYVGFESIEEYLAEKVRKAGVPEPEVATRSRLASRNCQCVLDGLDEVRPNLRAKVCEHINRFYSRHFSQDPSKVLIVTCRKEAYRDVPLDIPQIWEVRPLTNNQIQGFAAKWPLGYPTGKNKDTFWSDLEETPRILELARSPLLLVGGLMQYTESNLGIPDERFEYLGRVAKWLVSDWATAQGHPPDPLRSVYGRLLSRMAFHLHSNSTSECPLLQAIGLAQSWLPNLGLEASRAEEVIHSIAIRTGILVSEGDNTFVFAQFGLQEYFASLELLERISADKVAELEPKSWWREVILLAVAQMRNPGPLLNALFASSPLLAATAVAECPTPSTEMQERAVAACVEGVDRKEPVAAGAIVPLLRKISVPLEQRLCAALEQRLYEQEEIASLVGRCLATAGTTAATNVLGRHPEIWDKCLSEAGYMSSSFENMLVDVIRDGDDQESSRAAELLSSRLSSDRCVELTRLLPVLTPAKSERVASLLLRHVEEIIQPRFFFDPGFFLWVVSWCSPYIRDREGYLKTREMRRSQPQGISRRERHDSPLEYVDVVSTALFLDRGGRRPSQGQILNLLVNSLNWTTMRSAVLCSLCAAVVTLTIRLGGTPKALVCVGALLGVTLASVSAEGSALWLPARPFDREPSSLATALLPLAGVLVTLTLTTSTRYVFKIPVQVLYLALFAFCCSSIAIASWNQGFFWAYLVSRIRVPTGEAPGVHLRRWPLLAFASVIIGFTASSLLTSEQALLTWSLISLSALFLSWLAYVAIVLAYSHSAVGDAELEAMRVMAQLTAH
jgi:hypothetical protein